MKLLNLSKRQWTLLVVVLFLLITNPSIRAFKDYKGVTSFNGLRRSNNFFLCSVYKAYGNTYLGISENFFPLPKIKFEVANTALPNDTTNIDSAVTTTVSDSSSKIGDDEGLPIFTDAQKPKRIIRHKDIFKEFGGHTIDTDSYGVPIKR